MTNAQVVQIDALRSLAHGSISGSYAAVGTPLTFPARLVCITNNTDGDMIFSIDGVTDQLFVAASSFKLFDLQTNRLNVQQQWVLPIGTQFYVKQSTAPTKNSVYVEILGGVT
jgi:hypothetical protein